MSEQALVYVGCKPCGCRKGAIKADLCADSNAPGGISGVGAFLKHGGSIHTLTADAAARVPTGCDVCAPVRQERLL